MGEALLGFCLIVLFVWCLDQLMGAVFDVVGWLLVYWLGFA